MLPQQLMLPLFPGRAQQKFERNAKIVAARASGQTLAAIAAAFGLAHASVVHRILNRRGPRKSRWDLGREERASRDLAIVADRRLGHTQRAIAATHNVTQSAVYNVLARHSRETGEVFVGRRAKTADRDREVVAARRAGLTLAAIAARHGLTKGGVQVVLKRQPPD
jgi:lambda repressor-like predicted transcriptional regulator